jgi:hypothetical protein
MSNSPHNHHSYCNPPLLGAIFILSHTSPVDIISCVVYATDARGICLLVGLGTVTRRTGHLGAHLSGSALNNNRDYRGTMTNDAAARQPV